MTFGLNLKEEKELSVKTQGEKWIWGKNHTNRALSPTPLELTLSAEPHPAPDYNDHKRADLDHWCFFCSRCFQSGSHKTHCKCLLGWTRCPQ